MILYNCKTDQAAKSYGKAQYFITKFDDDLNVEASYCIAVGNTGFACTCPAFQRKSHCKHIDLLAKFKWREYVDTEWFYNADTESWHRPIASDFRPFQSPAVSPPAVTEAPEATHPMPASGATLTKRSLA